MFWLWADGTDAWFSKTSPPQSRSFPGPPKALMTPDPLSSKPRPCFHGEQRVSSCIIAYQLFINIWSACPWANVVFSTKCVVVCCKTFFSPPFSLALSRSRSLSVALFYKKNLFSYHFFCLFRFTCRIQKITKKKITNKQKDNKKTS